MSIKIWIFIFPGFDEFLFVDFSLFIFIDSCKDKGIQKFRKTKNFDCDRFKLKDWKIFIFSGEEDFIDFFLMRGWITFEKRNFETIVVSKRLASEEELVGK